MKPRSSERTGYLGSNTSEPTANRMAGPGVVDQVPEIRGVFVS
jgi:hypothetical protein